MRPLGCLVLFLALMGCSSDDSVVPDGGDAMPGDGAAPCSEGLATDLAVVAGASSTAVAITPDGSSILLVWIRSSGSSKSVMLAMYGPDGSVRLAPKALIATAGSGVSAAARADGFAVAWGDMLPPPGTSTPYPTVLFTVLGLDGTPVAQPGSNDAVGLSGPTDYVSAQDPLISATSSGYVVAWGDTRTLYPPQQGVNLADASGIYGRHVGLDGVSHDSSDVQVMQIGYSRWALGAGAVAWIAYGNNGAPADGTLQLATSLGSSPQTLLNVGTVQEVTLTPTASGAALTLSGGSQTGLVVYDASAQTAQSFPVDQAGSPSTNQGAAQVIPWPAQALSLVWFDGLGVGLSTNGPAQLRAADFQSAVQNLRNVGGPVTTALAIAGSPAVVGGTAYVPFVARPADQSAHVELATICSP